MGTILDNFILVMLDLLRTNLYIGKICLGRIGLLFFVLTAKLVIKYFYVIYWYILSLPFPGCACSKVLGTFQVGQYYLLCDEIPGWFTNPTR